ncbi:hypothetical protein M407DRAFT_20200 [Tulasnella calospora MUT 4182]|uniref:F-box domain-containing protein n=1 Tax=Tulasnella calospora MUT 4182 TaxID=1051891 RepID=A0A0C3MAF4_9AGAM|nr:hypothetical protein M407DRAFT_20200 [Tulasnella calospora MUT 4182]
MADIYGLRLVSKVWKELIEDTPWFWTEVSSDWPTAVIRDCLRLSRNHLLRVTVSSDWFDRRGKDSIKKFQLLQPHAERWETLNYNTDRLAASDARRAKDILESPAPNLQSLCASILKAGLSPPPTLNLAGGKANQLKHLRLENILVPWSSQLLTGLETFNLSIEGTVPVRQIVDIFIKNPGLRSFHLSYRSAGGQDIPTLSTSADSNTFHVTANSLEELNLCFDDPRIASHILSQVSMPACRSLKLAVESMAMMDDIHSLNVAFSQFIPKIGYAMSQSGRTTFYAWPEQPFQWSVTSEQEWSITSEQEWNISSEQELLQFSLEFSHSSLDRFIECVRNLALASESQLELEVRLGPTPPPHWIADELGGWSEITKLHVSSPSSDFHDGRDDEVMLFPDYLGQTRVDPGPGLSWPFPNLRELDLSELECPLLKVFDMLNRRYLSSSDVQSMEDLEIPVNIPPKLDIQIRYLLEWGDAVILPAVKNHRGVKSLE